MGRLSGVRVKLDECINKLTEALAEKPCQPSKLKSIETLVETYRELLHAENDAKTIALETENSQLKSELNAITEQWGTLTPEQVKSQVEEGRAARGQLETVRNSNSGLLREREQAKAEVSQTKDLLKWMCEQVSPEARLKIAVSAFLKFHAKAAPIIDCLYPLGTCKEFVSISYSKQSLIDTVRSRQHSPDSDNVLPVQFATLYAREKHQLDIPELLKAQAAENFRKSQDEDRQRGEMQQSQAIAYNKRMRESARELDIARGEAGLPIVTWVDKSERW